MDPAAIPQPVDQFNIVLSDMMIISKSINNEFRIGYNRRAPRRRRQRRRTRNWAKQLGMPNVTGATFPYFNIGYGMAGLTSYQNVGDDFTLQDKYTKIKGDPTPSSSATK